MFEQSTSVWTDEEVSELGRLAQVETNQGLKSTALLSEGSQKAFWFMYETVKVKIRHHVHGQFVQKTLLV